MLKFFAHCIAYLPFWLLYRLSDLLAWFARKLYRRKLVSRNLRACFPGYTIAQLQSVRRAFYQNLTDVSLEVFKSLRMDRQAFEQRVKIVRNDAFEEIKSRQRPFLLYASHQCNWEWLGLAVAVQLAPLDSVYKTIKKESVNELMKQLRSRFGTRLVSNKEAARALRAQEGFRGAGLIADQTPTRRNKGKVWAPFLGQDTAFYKGIFALPYLTQQTAYYIHMTRKDRGVYEAEIVKLADPPHSKNDYSLLDKYIRNSASAIQTHPANWLWSHNRWKYARGEGEELVL